MESNIDMAQHSIINLKKPEDHQATYAANVKCFADAIVDNNTILETLIDTKIEASETRAIVVQLLSIKKSSNCSNW